MKMDDVPMSLDDSVGVEEIPAKDNDGVPYCRQHHCRMQQTSGGRQGAPKAYYACPVPKCKETARRIKTLNEKVVPSNPVHCPRCSKGAKNVFCERDDKASTAAMVILKCPSCGWKSNAMAVPQLAAAYFAGRRSSAPVEEIGAR